MINKLAIVVIALMSAESSFANGTLVDLSKPFRCPDISPNTMHISQRQLFIGGIGYPIYDDNSSISQKISNIIFKNQDNTVEIDLTQFTDSGKISMSYIKFSISQDLIPINNQTDIEETINKYKLYEKVTEDPKSYLGNTDKLQGSGQGCKNI